MAKPIVAIVGRPNVGKSTFFNRIAGRRIAIVEDTPGVTRDRIYSDAEWTGHNFTVIDTGGIEPRSTDEILIQMKNQAELAIETADVILFIVDAKEGLLPADEEVSNILRRSYKPVLLVVNKADNKKDEHMSYDFYSLGFEDLFMISASQGLGIGDLLDGMIEHFPSNKDEEDDEDTLKIALVGKPNVGKSSLANKILGQNRSIVSAVPGTTRDAIDSSFEKDGNKYLIIDTAGMRKKGRIDRQSIERYSVIRSLTAVKRAQVAVVMIDAKEGVTEQDVKVAGFVHEEGKPSVIAVNKWDAVEKDTFTIEKYKKDLRSALAFMSYVPIVFISAVTGQRIDRLFKLIHDVHQNNIRRITTGLLNECITEAITVTEPPASKGRRLKIFYATQAVVAPPTFIFFVNEPELLHFSYKRYLENYLRKTFDFSGTPIKIIIRKRND